MHLVGGNGMEFMCLFVFFFLGLIGHLGIFIKEEILRSKCDRFYDGILKPIGHGILWIPMEFNFVPDHNQTQDWNGIEFQFNCNFALLSLLGILVSQYKFKRCKVLKKMSFCLLWQHK